MTSSAGTSGSADGNAAPGRRAAGLILAAGAGTRFASAVSAAGVSGAAWASRGSGGFRGESESKLLAELDGRPLLSYAVEAMCAVTAVSPVVVVLGFGAEEIRARVSFGRASAVVCPDWQQGQAASLRCGLRALSEADRVIVTLGDEPLVSSEVIARFVDAPVGSRAVYRGQPGHPVLLGAQHISALMALRGDRGARDLLRGGPTIECGELCSGRDVDTPEDLQAIRDDARAAV
jgi:CTP:molybdopterin cytidylyltransferase MocA